MYKTGLIRLLFNFEAKNRHDLYLHYYNVGRLISIAPKVKDHLYIELVNYNNINFDRSLNSPTQQISKQTTTGSSEINEKVEKIYNDLFFSWSEIDKKMKIEKKQQIELDDSESPSLIVSANIEPLKRLENIFFNYYQILYNENPRLNVSIIPLDLINQKDKEIYNNNNNNNYTQNNNEIDILFLDSSMNLFEQENELKLINEKFINSNNSIKSIDSTSINIDFSYPKHFYEPSQIGKNLTKWTPPFGGVVLGGTFDRMHPGHKVMLTMAALVCSDYMEVGITDNSILTSKKYSELITPFEFRSEKTLNFLKSINPSVEYNMLKLVEPYANTMTSKKLECIVISPEVYKTAIKINTVRRETKLKPLEIYSISYFDTPHQGDDVKLSSSYLRELDFKEMMKNKQQQQQQQQ
ncbi:hypothetical protein DDB_G0288465 [Dictyostelium discoideum AX4]|uniref:Cytidyltransferase-like domain-containing protein n=1 Tax=Dictyostelium discoideum TaxID=44689 RepID=Q54IX0_DICDI|nr:hypothetical protein DDB_G0288465 [Dictyostelium discoideum AX4]EAL63204.1 hypothetical protein DDB_G0288465 [Dictyostelium discoideum AX4]|eukprot:XP_636706.1 hypothetical protein DDB_G0288465 [Dictyostelium discoideum AX4]